MHPRRGLLIQSPPSWKRGWQRAEEMAIARFSNLLARFKSAASSAP
jgi:hypothetical protein